jgi:hypothetical protein
MNLKYKELKIQLIDIKMLIYSNKKILRKKLNRTIINKINKNKL